MKALSAFVRLAIILLVIGSGMNLPASAAGAAFLDSLFDRLKSAPDEHAAQEITGQIWLEWLSPTDPVLAVMMLGAETAHQNHDFSEAMARTDEIIAMFPDYAEGWNLRATMNYELGRYQQSLADIAQTLTREPRHFGALSGKALVHLALGNEDEARKAITEALKIHPFIANHPPFNSLVKPTFRT